MATDWTTPMTALATGLTTGGVALIGQFLTSRRQRETDITRMKDAARQVSRGDQREVYKNYLGGYRALEAMLAGDRGHVEEQLRGLNAIGDEVALIGCADVRARLETFSSAVAAVVADPGMSPESTSRARTKLVEAMKADLDRTVF